GAEQSDEGRVAVFQRLDEHLEQGQLARLDLNGPLVEGVPQGGRGGQVRLDALDAVDDGIGIDVDGARAGQAQLSHASRPWRRWASASSALRNSWPPG